MKSLLLAASALALIAGIQVPARASSHREAPMIAGMPKLDASDFFLFRAYEPGHSANVVMIADYIPLQDPEGGPNFFYMDHTGYYDINVDTTGTGVPDKTFRFRFTDHRKNLALDIGGKMVAIPLINDGMIVDGGNNAAVNRSETYTISLVTYVNGKPTETLLSNGGGATEFKKPIDDVGEKSIPDYPTYASKHRFTFQLPNCPGHGLVFVGQRKDPFVVNLGETFDLVNYLNPVGEQYANTTRDDLAAKNVTSIAIEVPIKCLLNGSDPVIGAYTTSSLGVTTKKGTTYTQVSRLANPLVNELVIGLKDKDKFNASTPKDDAQFIDYVTNPTVPTLIEKLFGTAAPTAFPRIDLVAVFLTGIKGVNQPANPPAGSEEMRLNTSIAPTPYGSQDRLGVIDGDNAGYPNGRRPGDDVVDITLRVAMGKLFTAGLFGNPGDAPSGGLAFTDGAFTDDTHFDQTFPYVKNPIPGSPQSVNNP